MSSPRESEATFFGMSSGGSSNGRKRLSVDFVKMVAMVTLFLVGQIGTGIWFASSISFQVSQTVVEIQALKNDVSVLSAEVSRLTTAVVKLEDVEEKIKDLRLRIRDLERIRR